MYIFAVIIHDRWNEACHIPSIGYILLKIEKGTPGKASPLKISLPGEVDLMQEVRQHTQASDAI